MSYFEPQLVGKIGERQFVLHNGDITKEFYNVGLFDIETGMYPILNEKEEVVEYMDMLGNFSKHTTKFAYHFYKYAVSSKDVPFLVSSYMKISYSGLVDFPSRYLADEKIKEIIKKEEKRRFKYARRHNEFDSLIDIVRYRIYLKQVWADKVLRAERFKETLEKAKDNEIVKEQ